MAGQKSLFQDAGDGGGFSRPRGDSDMDLDITPMIDVTFLLLIFFMVTSTMQASVDLDVPVAKHGVGTEKRGATIITIKANDGSPIILLGDGKGLEASVDEVAAYVEDGINERQNMQVIIKADREVPHGFVQQVERVVVDFEGITFSIGVEDKPSAR